MRGGAPQEIESKTTTHGLRWRDKVQTNPHPTLFPSDSPPTRQMDALLKWSQRKLLMNMEQAGGGG